MARHVVLGAGPVGSAIATNLLERGEDVTVVTRSGGGPEGTTRVRTDVADATALSAVAEGAQVIYNALNPADYNAWPTTWPPLAASILTAAERSGAVVAVVDNLYPFGPVDVPMSAALPDRPSSVKGAIRMRMWQDLLAAVESGRISGAVAVRGSDYVGAGPSLVSLLVYARAAQGKRAFVPADLDAPHTWTNPGDAGRLLVEAALDPQFHGRYWLVPSAPAVSVRVLAERAGTIAGWPPVRLSHLPRLAVQGAGVFSSMAKATLEMAYQFHRPFLVDASETAERFGGGFTPLDESLVQNLTDAGFLGQPARASS
ncbi:MULTISPECIES: NAD-dependent epimerase/dehydratase family protein [unclassified Knoellia]|uniref:NAD-dependent epimerase/dehydratase family protein n=1 Tax=Knoellia altitudinis TaxID=3404795 RepID=UPI003614038F